MIKDFFYDNFCNKKKIDVFKVKYNAKKYLFNLKLLSVIEKGEDVYLHMFLYKKYIYKKMFSWKFNIFEIINYLWYELVFSFTYFENESLEKIRNNYIKKNKFENHSFILYLLKYIYCKEIDDACRKSNDLKKTHEK